MILGRDRQETILLTAMALEITTLQAGFIVAQELDEIDGDVIAVGKDGNAVRSTP